MSGVNLRYVASSGRIYNLRGDTLRTRSSANFHEWSWGTSGVNLQYGTRVSAFTRAAKVYETTLTLFGTTKSKLEFLNSLHDDFELDVRNITPGRLIWNDYYIDCYATASDTKPDKSNMIVDNKVSFFCPHPFWIKEEKKSFYPQESVAEETFLDYPYGYAYDYYSGGTGADIWVTDFPFESDFKMVIYGPAANPRIMINGHAYQILDVLQAAEYCVIDSKLGTIIKTTASGQKVNIFDLRNKSESVFEKIPADILTISWPGAFGFDLTLYEERSEPR